MMLVRFSYHGSNHHCRAAKDDAVHFQVAADPEERRAKKVNERPKLIGYSTRSGYTNKIKEEQEMKWIELCQDLPRNQRH